MVDFIERVGRLGWEGGTPVSGSTPAVGPVKAGVVGASGYVGGELLRLLAGHPGIEVTQATSERHADSAVQFVHPHLRGRDLVFRRSADVEECDLLFLCLPHRKSMEQIDRFAGLAPRIVDLSADFRLADAEAYERWYGTAHAAPEWLEWFVYGLPELTRDELAGKTHASGVGCNATATNLSLLPLARQPELVDWSRGVITELKVGSSEGGASASEASHHPIRSGVVRSFAPTGHRHTAEVDQALVRLGVETTVHISVTGVERVRGVLATSHLFLQDGVSEKELYRAYRGLVKSEPFVRFVKERRGMYRLAGAQDPLRHQLRRHRVRFRRGRPGASSACARSTT